MFIYLLVCSLIKSVWNNALVSKFSHLWILGNCLSIQQTNWMFGTEMATLWRSIIGFWFEWSNSWPQPKKCEDWSDTIDFYDLLLAIVSSPFSFSFFFSRWKFLFFSSAWIWITELKLNTSFGICFFMELLCRGVLLIAFILQEKVCNHKLCGPFCHFNTEFVFVLIREKKRFNWECVAFCDCNTTAMGCRLKYYCLLLFLFFLLYIATMWGCWFNFRVLVI